MSFDFINLVISGRLTKDPDIKRIDTQNGQTNVLSFTIANNYRKRENESNFFDCQYWTREIPGFLSDRLKKGTFVVLNGYLKQEKWTSSVDQSTRSKVVIVVTNFLSIDNKNYVPKNQDSDKESQTVGSTSNSNNKFQSEDEKIHEIEDVIGDDSVIDPDFDGFEGFEEPNNFS